MAYHSNGYSGSERDHDRDDRSSVGGDKPTYLIEHLATFTVTKDTGIEYPADGMRRLLQLEKSNGIWSQKMQLCLDRNWVLIMDYETGVNSKKKYQNKRRIYKNAFCFSLDYHGKISRFFDSRTNSIHKPRSNGNV